MNEKNWDECLFEGSVKHKSNDIKKSESLKRTAEGRIRFFEKQIINEDSAN